MQWYGYDGFNRLVAVTNAATSVSYTYRPDGLRYGKMINGATTQHLWDGGTDEMSERQGNPNRRNARIGAIRASFVLSLSEQSYKDNYVAERPTPLREQHAAPDSRATARCRRRDTCCWRQGLQRLRRRGILRWREARQPQRPPGAPAYGVA